MSERRRRGSRAGPRFPTWAETLVVVAAFAVLMGIYVLLSHVLLQVVGTGESAGRGDGWYFGLQGVMLLMALLVGTALGSLSRRSLFSFAMLFFAAMLVGLIATQLAAFQLACEGHNDIIRHWQCQAS